MNILIVSRRYIPFAGGAENQLSRTAEALRRQNHVVRVLTGHYDKTLLRCEEKRGVMIQRLPDTKLRIIGTIIFLLHLIREMLHRNHYDIVLASMINETSSIAVLMAKIMKKKIFFRVSSRNNFRQKKLYRKLVFMADGMIAQTEDLKQAAIESGYPSEKITVIPNMISEYAFMEHRKISSGFHILWCGRLHPDKNPLFLIGIARKLKGKCTFCIDVVGNGEQRGLLEKMISEEGLSGNFKLHGFQKETAPFYQKADIYLLTSERDAMPNTILEAMAASLPIAASNVGGVPLLVRNQQEALLFPAGNAVAAMDAILYFHEHPDYAAKIGKMAQKRAKKVFSENSIVKSYTDLFSVRKG